MNKTQNSSKKIDFESLGKAEVRLALAQAGDKHQYVLTKAGHQYWKSEKYRDGFQKNNQPSAGQVGQLAYFKGGAFQVPLSLMKTAFSNAYLVPIEYSNKTDSWPSEKILMDAIKESQQLPNQAIEKETPNQKIGFQDMVVVGYTYTGSDPYQVLSPFEDGFKVSQPDEAYFAVGGVPGIYFNKHVKDFEFKVKITYLGFHNNANVIGHDSLNTGIFIGNRKINFNQLGKQISPFFAQNNIAVIEPWGSIFNSGHTVNSEGWSGTASEDFGRYRSHQIGDSVYIIFQCLGNKVRTWMAYQPHNNKQKTTVVTQKVKFDASWNQAKNIADAQETVILNRPCEGAFGLQIEGSDFTATQMSIKPIDDLSDLKTRPF